MDSENDSNLANLQKLPYVTILFIAANVIIWLILELMGDTQDSLFMIEHGAAYQPFIFDNGEYYRLFTSMFLHFGADHLMNNMLVLGVTGFRLENMLGSVRFAVLYLGSGLCSSLFSLYEKLGSTDLSVTAGASGAVFGVVGGLLAWVLCNRGKAGGLTAKGLLGMAALSLYFGFTSSGVDNWGHIGGLIGGFSLGCIYGIASKIRNH
ncbi:MAG: rhomboid family intramembrane serine protease [Eubacterium sp.]|nr:rhomboid family intramembrane serine protease [Eubacterium sp.]